MSRSTKKGFFVEERLMQRIDDMNEKSEKRVIRTWSRASTIFPEMVDIRSQSMTDASTFRYISQKIW